MATARRVSTVAAQAGGTVLAGAVRVLSARPAAKPLHPRGTVLPARLHRRGATPTTGVPWLDEPGTDEALVRFSQSVGLPERLPDVQGLAIRVNPQAGRPGDLLLSSSGWRPGGRHVLVPSRRLHRASTLVPYRTPGGPVMIGAERCAEDVYELSWATPTGRWQAFAELVVRADEPLGDIDVSFDAVLHELPGLANYAWVRRLREPGYAMARRSRARRG